MKLFGRIRNVVYRYGIVLSLVAFLSNTPGPTAAGEAVPDLAGGKVSEEGPSLTDLSRTMDEPQAIPHTPPEDWKPRATEVRSRGFGARVYEKVAPAVVVVRVGTGHGTGFFIRPDGWLLTNHHVIARAPYDPELGGSRVTVYVGRPDPDGWMQVVDEEVPAVVYKSNSRQDLALVKLARLPKGMKEVPYVELAESLPRPSTDCVSIGHPGVLTLWTVREGQLAGAGVFPDSRSDVVIQRLGLSSADRKRVDDFLQSQESRKVFYSTCRVLPGDSGGPLVNKRGELIAVTFAIPVTNPQTSETAEISLHVHLDEVKDFLEGWPEQPAPLAPTPYPPGTSLNQQLLDVNQDGYPETLVFVADGKLAGLRADLDSDSIPKDNVSGLNKTNSRVVVDRWDAEFAIVTLGKFSVFYDTNNDGEFDAIFRDESGDGTPETLFRLTESGWSAERSKASFIDAAFFTDTKLVTQFKSYVKHLGSFLKH